MEIGPVIKNPVLDINKLVRQGTLLNQSVQNVEGDSTADQATVDLLARKDPVIQEIAVGMSGEESTQYTVSGTPPLSLPNSLGKPLKAWSVDVLPYQEGTGDPSPSNVRPIHGTDKLTITTAGANMCNPNGFTTGKYVRAGNPSESQPLGAEITSQYWSCTDYILVAPSTVYTQCLPKYQSASAAGLVFYVDKTVASAISGVPASSQGSAIYTFTTPATCKYVRISWNNNVEPTTEYVNPQLTTSNTALPYEPYNGTQTVLTLPQTVYTGTIGSEGGESRWGEVDLGALNWSAYSAGVNTYRAKVNDKAFGDVNVLTDIYATRVTAFSNMDNCTIRGTSGNTYIYVRDDAYTDVNSFKLAVTGHKLIYELATPSTFVVPSPTIPTPTGTATTWATAEDGIVDGMEVTYVGKA